MSLVNLTTDKLMIFISEKYTNDKRFRLHFVSYRRNQQEPRFPVNIGITGYVAATGEASSKKYFLHAKGEFNIFCQKRNINCVLVKQFLLR